jgi:hypothetical protein
MSRPRCALSAFSALMLLWLAAAPASIADGDTRAAEEELVERYSPRLMLREQEDPPCDTDAEQYEATTVATVLGNPTVELSEAPDGREIPLERGPTAADIAGLGEEHHLNLEGEPLGDTCVYARAFARLKREGKAPPVTYAHVAREAGRSGLAVQYWFFWYFNQFNDLHEGDWEGMQISFAASTPRAALEEEPREVALYQHAGGERADWDGGKVQKEGDHPVVYPAAGSHATFYDAAIYVENGRKGSGVGCDNTTAPHTRLNVRPVLVPTRPSPNGRFRWLTYEGRWGQLAKGFNNGPTGPLEKERWREPLSWQETTRSSSPRLPAGSVLGPTVASAFCGTVAEVTSLLNRNQEEPWLLPTALLLAAALLALLVFGTRWRPPQLHRLRTRRALGQILHADLRLYSRHWRAFALIGLSAIPVVGGLTLLSWLIAGGETGQRIDDSSGLSGLHVAIGEAIQGIGQPLAQVVMAAATIVAMRQLVEWGRTGFAGAYREMLPRFWRVVGAQLLAIVAVFAMAITIVGLPFAAWKFIRWQFVQQEILFNDHGIRDAFRASSELVKGRWWLTLRVAGILWLISVTAGPVLGFALIFTNLSLFLINAIGTVVYALLIPYVAIGGTLLWFDLQARGEEGVQATPLRERLRRRQALSPARQP